MFELAEDLPNPIDQLSAEELRWWNHVSSLGERNRLGGNEAEDLFHVKPVKDGDLSAVILALEASTVAFQGQTNLLKSQLQHQVTWMQRGALSEKTSHKTTDQALSKKQLELQRLQFTIEETHQSLIERVQSYHGVSIQRRSEIAMLLTNGLDEHDRSLIQLRNATHRLISPPRLQPELSIRTRSLIDKLVVLLGEEIHERLDRLFLTTLHEISESEQQNGSVAETSAGSLETDLESLHAEITDVAVMFVRDQFEQPIFQAMRREQIHRAKEVTAVTTEAVAELELLVEWLENFTGYCETFSSFGATLRTIGHHISNDASAYRRGNESKSIQIQEVNRHTTSLEALLGYLGVSQEHLTKLVSMGASLASKAYHLDNVLSNTVAPSCTLVHDHLGIIDRVSQTVTDASWADGQHEARKKLDSTDEQIASLGRRLEAANISKATNANADRQEFLTQWT